MKKILLMASALFFATGCKKESKEITTENQTDTEVTAQESAKIKIISKEDLSSILSEKDNDTVYVTNFFATWCPPCMREIPHFIEKMEETKGSPVKFTFISLDEQSDWDGDLKDFAKKHQLANHILIANNKDLSKEFYSANFKTYDGGSIPFTFVRKRNKTSETVGSMSKSELDEKINSVQ